MAEEVNAKLPPGQQFQPVGWHFSKTLRLYREYRKYYPDGDLLLKVYGAGVLLFISLLVVAWTLGFFSS